MSNGRRLALDGRRLVLVVVVGHPRASHVAGASKTNGKAAWVAAARKRTAFAIIGEGAGGFDFVPIAVQTAGRTRCASFWSPVTWRLLATHFSSSGFCATRAGGIGVFFVPR